MQKSHTCVEAAHTQLKCLAQQVHPRQPLRSKPCDHVALVESLLLQLLWNPRTPQTQILYSNASDNRLARSLVGYCRVLQTAASDLALLFDCLHRCSGLPLEVLMCLQKHLLVHVVVCSALHHPTYDREPQTEQHNDCSTEFRILAEAWCILHTAASCLHRRADSRLALRCRELASAQASVPHAIVEWAHLGVEQALVHSQQLAHLGVAQQLAHLAARTSLRLVRQAARCV